MLEKSISFAENNPDSEMPDVRVINNWKHHIYVRIVSETVIYNEVRKIFLFLYMNFVFLDKRDESQ